MWHQSYRAVSLMTLIALALAALLGAGCQAPVSPTTAPVAPPAAPTAAASPTQPATPVTAAAVTRTIVDQAGKSVTIPNVVKRVAVVQGACNLPVILSAMGVGDTLVGGLCMKGGAEDWQLKVEPGYAKLDPIKPGESGAVNIEQILTLKPDVLFVWTNVKNVDQIRAAGISVVQIDVSSYDQVKQMFTMTGEIMGKQDRAQKINAYIDEISERLKKKMAGLADAQRKKALFVTNSNPLTVMGAPSHNRFMIEISGGTNVTNDLPTHYNTVSIESVAKMDPDIILVMASQDATLKEIKTSPAWQAVRAAKAGSVYMSPRGAFLWDKPGPETPLFLMWQAHLFYPDLVSEDEVRTETRRFFKDFFGYTLTDADVKGMIGY